jgi:hypothetical protein
MFSFGCGCLLTYNDSFRFRCSLYDTARRQLTASSNVYVLWQCQLITRIAIADQFKQKSFKIYFPTFWLDRIPKSSVDDDQSDRGCLF